VVAVRIVRIRGRNRVEAKKRALNFYVSNRELLGGSMKDFFKRCTIDPSGRTIIYRGE
jgi:hypothetical protein